MATAIWDKETVDPFYEHLQTYVARDEMPKRQLAMRAGISRVYLDKLLQRESKVSLEVAISLANAMGTSLENILKKSRKSQLT